MSDYINRINERIRHAGVEHLLPLVDAATNMPFFAEWPASVGVGGKPWHHGDAGGLARHTWQVLDIALAMAAKLDLYPGPLAVAAVWHDIGKLECYIQRPDGGFEKTMLHHSHHISVGLSWWGSIGYSLLHQRPYIQQGADASMFSRVRHMIESHHGRREWGSPSEPHTMEALILHHADMQSVMLDKLENRNHQNQ